MLLFATRRSCYAIDPGLGMLMQLPGGTDCGLRQGVWHAVVYDEQPCEGRPFFCSVAPRDGGAPVAIRTSAVGWVGPEPPVPAFAEIFAPALRG
ncbi:MAG TPA: hypothetical protein VFQ85_15185 [Mycobacteriales bacterium]|jgi:hypothetical protein|nr:hypothetical protein [Mycobacteriales bacterium]